MHTIAIQVPITDLTRDGCMPTDPIDPRRDDRRLGAASRQKVLRS